MIKTKKHIQKSELRKIFDSAPEDSINFGLGEIQFPTPSYFICKAHEIIEQGKIYYTPNAGLKELREAIAGYYKIAYDNVCVTTGAEEAIFATMFTYIEPGDEVMIANPSYLAYKNIINMLSGIPVEFDLKAEDNFTLDRNSFQQAISEKTKIVFLNNPSNPLGRSFSNSEIDFIISLCKSNDILLIIDEVYLELHLHEKTNSMIGENIVVISSLSKSHCMSGWRLGWCASKTKQLITPIISSHQYICTCAPYLSQRIAIEAFTEKGWQIKEQIREKLVDNYNYTIGLLKNELPDLHILPSEFAPYLFVKLTANDLALTRSLLKNRLIIMPGSIFGSQAKGWIRINYGVEKHILMKGLKILINKTKSLTD